MVGSYFQGGGSFQGGPMPPCAPLNAPPVVHVLIMHVQTCSCVQIDAVKITGVDCMLTLTVAHQTTKPCS